MNSLEKSRRILDPSPAALAEQAMPFTLTAASSAINHEISPSA
jgi:hypothetical protein